MNLIPTLISFFVLNRSEQLLRERMRIAGRGIVKYDYFSSTKQILSHGVIPQLLDLNVCLLDSQPLVSTLHSMVAV